MSDLDPVALLASFVIDDDGTRWGDVAIPYQWASARAFLSVAPDSPRMHWDGRPRGGSKTTDHAAVDLAAMLCQAPTRSTSLAYASDRDQAAILLEHMRAMVERTALGGLVEVTTWGLRVIRSGATLTVEPADAPSAHGHVPYIVTVDELAQWPETRGHRALWHAIVSGLPKRKDSRLAVLTTAGDPAHWSAGVLEGARGSPRWTVREMAGPVPWQDPADIAEQQRLLPGSVFARLILNRWTGGEDRLVSAEDLAACVTHPGPIGPESGHVYVIGADLGLTNDRTVITVCHGEPGDGGPVVTLDHLEVLEGSTGRPVQLSEVEARLRALHGLYRSRVIRLDPWQGVHIAQRLRAAGVNVETFAFTAQSVVRLALALHLTLRERRMRLPDDARLLDELGTVRLRETAAGLRMDHDAGKHDDQAMALALATLALVERPPVGPIAPPRPARGRIPEHDWRAVARGRSVRAEVVDRDGVPLSGVVRLPPSGALAGGRGVVNPRTSSVWRR
ncbi:terminase large subunit domain-containing protein [Demequina subtropica]|uniref:terminase large subunit domain-containing protein n=1 Tax=Demequina subtropica TaxID=1638989 RepID=UPI00078354FF|nr:terminase large subunit [Demequina subtropica]